MSNSIIIRKAVLEDLETLLSFEQELIKFERPFDASLAEDPISYYDIKKMITSTDVEVAVAVYNDEVIGSGYARIETPKPYLKYKKYAYVGFIFVKPEYRGGGIMSLVINSLKLWASSKGVYDICLDVYSKNKIAIKAYEKIGFQQHMINMRLSSS